jgi:hypothetical protein
MLEEKECFWQQADSTASHYSWTTQTEASIMNSCRCQTNHGLAQLDRSQATFRKLTAQSLRRGNRQPQSALKPERESQSDKHEQNYRQKNASDSKLTARHYRHRYKYLSKSTPAKPNMLPWKATQPLCLLSFRPRNQQINSLHVHHKIEGMTTPNEKPLTTDAKQLV